MKKIRLRALEETDLEFLHEMRRDPVIERNLKFYWPLSLSGQKKWFESTQSNQSNKLLIIEGASSDKEPFNLEWNSIGNARIQHIDHLNKTAEIGLDICEKFRGKGFGKLAFQEIMDFCFNKLAMRKLYLYVFAFNEVGVAVYEKHGFKVEGVLKKHVFKDGKYEDLLLMSTFQKED